MSFTVHGIGVSDGIAIGPAQLAAEGQLEVAHYSVPPSRVAEEVVRLEGALAAVRRELQDLKAHIPAHAPAELEAFLDVHMMILADATLSERTAELIRSQQCNAEWALKQQADALMAQFDRIGDSYMRERKADVRQVVERVLKSLLGHGNGIPVPPSPEQGNILVAHDLSPADVVQFKQHPYASFVTDVGSATSHTAILARSLNIPCIMALHHARQLIREGDLLIVDGDQGVVIVNPDSPVLAEYRLRRREWELGRQKLKRLRTTAATTLDGTPVELHANIELPEDVAQAQENGATGIGLFRTEFLFLKRGDLPDEQEQFEAYRKVVMAMDGLPITIRTLDFGADKQLGGITASGTNPALGLRAIRLCLAEPKLFIVQLRALLRASAYGTLRILIPMLSTAAEIRQTHQLIEEAKRSLEADGIAFDRDTEIGGMIEIPAAALTLKTFLRELDFLSIGTNDLIQYTLAIDRTDDSVAHLYDPLHPAVLQLLARVIRTANQAKISVSICGEVAGDVALTRLLLGLGLRVFSMHPAQLLEVKQRILQSSVPAAESLTKRILRTEDPQRISSLLAKLNV